MSKEIRLGGLDESDSPNWAIFDNVIHIPEDEDIAVVYGPNRSGKSTMLRAIAGTMDLFRESRKGWDDANIGLIPPYKVEFTDESNLSDNVVYTTNFRQPWVDWQEMPLDELIDWLQEKGSVEDKEMYRTFNMGMGMLIIVNKNDAEKSVSILGEHAQIIGSVNSGTGVKHSAFIND